MQRQLSSPIQSVRWCWILAGLPFFSLFAAEIPVETAGFDPVNGGETVDEKVRVNVSTFDELAYSASNPSDVVIVSSISLIALDENDEANENDDNYIYVASYEGFDTTSRTNQDRGRMLIEVPADYDNISAPRGVGFFRKQGPWTKTGETRENVIAGMTGTLTYESLQETRPVDFEFSGNYQGSAFSMRGSSSATVFSKNTVSVNAWTASEDSDYAFSFNTVGFSRFDNRYLGLLWRTDSEEPEDWENRFALVKVTDPNDADGDGVPDFSDLGSQSAAGILSANSISLGENQIWSNDLNTSVALDPEELWLYGENLGWFYLPEQDDNGHIKIYIPDENLGWLWTNESLSPYYMRESDGSEVYFELIDGEVWYYDFQAEKWMQPIY